MHGLVWPPAMETDRGDLIQLAVPDVSVKAAKQEKTMNGLIDGAEAPVLANRAPTSPCIATPSEMVALSSSEDYAEFLRVSPLDALPDAHEFLIQSQLRSGKAPDALHTRHRLVMTAESLLGLHKYLGQYLSRALSEDEASVRLARLPSGQSGMNVG